MSGWLPAATSLAIGWSSGTSMPGRSHGGPGGVGEHAQRGRVGEAALPTPFGPASSQAWWSRPIAQARRELRRPRRHGRRVTAADPRCAASRRCGDLFRRARRIDHADALGLLGGDARKARSTAVIIVAAAADPVAAPSRVPRPSARSAPSSSVSTKVRSGKQSPTAERVERAHRLDAESAGAALISERAVDEAIAEHPLARARAPGRIVLAT